MRNKETTNERVSMYGNVASANATEGYAILKRSIYANASISEINVWASTLDEAIEYCEANASDDFITLICDYDFAEHSELVFESAKYYL